MQEFIDLVAMFFERCLMFVQYDKIIHVTNVVFRFEFVFDVVVEFVEVDVGEELACPIA